MVLASLYAVAAVFLYMNALFLYATFKARNDIADVAWGPGFVLITFTALLATKNITPSSMFLAVLVCVWGFRLAWHIGRRFFSKQQEDARYAAWRRSWGKWVVARSYGQIFLLQGALMLGISMPILFTVTATPAPLRLLHGGAILLWLFGFVFESVADKQLRVFLAHKNGGILETGLWKYSRHPNYFGEVVQWWAIGLYAFAASASPWVFVGPALITFLILFVSGIPMLERRFADNPQFQAYAKKTSIFFPLPPKQP